MYLPHTYGIALMFMIGSMLCWGSWANSMKLSPGYRFQLFYWDYILGLVVGVLLLGVTIGSTGSGSHFLQGIAAAPSLSITFAILSGILFNIANLLLVAAIEVAGMAVAFPVGIGLALVIGALSSYVISPKGNPVLLFGGIALVVVAILCDSLAYRAREKPRASGNMRGIVLSLLSGVLMGSFYPFASRSMTVPGAPGPYVTAFFFVIGTVLCSLPLNYLFMKRPVDGGAPVNFDGYLKAPMKWHAAGILGGAIWVTGATLNFVASQVHFVGPAVSYSIGQGATLISALWGVFVWQEFRLPSRHVRNLLTAMFICFVVGLVSIAVAPLFPR